MRAIKIQIRALAGTVVFAICLLGLWFYMSRPLAKYDEPPERSIKLIEMQKNGLVDFTLQDIEGRPLRLSAFKGKIIILNFWASWCEPCVQEFPSLQKLVDKYSGELVLIAVSNDHTMEDLRAFLRAFKITSPNIHVAWDQEGDLAKQYGVMALPESFLAGRDFKVIRKVSGAEDWFSPSAQAYFQSLIAPGP